MYFLFLFFFQQLKKQDSLLRVGVFVTLYPLDTALCTTYTKATSFSGFVFGWLINKFVTTTTIICINR